MNWNRHSELEGSHAFLSASKYHWINYDSDKLAESYNSYMATQKGTELHDFASRCITLGQKLPGQKKTLNMFVNDAIGYKMQSEQVLYYSGNCYGTADAISFRKNMLRVHDLKTGRAPAHMEQLMVYAALFCLEYKVKPGDIRWSFGSIRMTRYCTTSPSPTRSRRSWTRLSALTRSSRA